MVRQLVGEATNTLVGVSALEPNTEKRSLGQKETCSRTQATNMHVVDGAIYRPV
jgi:hypothetical protein